MIIATDFDGTLTTGAMGRATGEYLTANGKEALYKPFMRKQLPRYILAKLGLYNMRRFKTGWAVEMVSLFKGFSTDELHRMFAYVVENELWAKRRPLVVEELIRHQAAGHRVVIVSGAYQPMLELFAARLNAEAFGTPLEMVDGHAAGRIVEPLNIGAHKVNRLKDVLHGASLDMAYGDTLDDLPMLMLSQTPVAVYPDKRLRTVALEKGWRILED